MAKVRTEEVKLTVEGQEMATFVALPQGAGPHPAVLVFEEIYGVNSHIRDVAERLAGEGYFAIAPDFHHRAWATGTQLGYDEAGRKKGMTVIPSLSGAGIEADIAATLAYVAQRPEASRDKLGAIGFCIGGHVAFLAAATHPFAATASFYGGGIATFSPGGGPKTVERAGDIKGKILCLFGRQDQSITPEEVQTIERALEAKQVRHEVVVYDQAGHGFFCDQRPSYDAEAAADAWERVKRLFAEELA